MSSVTIYGASDDLIEVEGDIKEEFGCYDGSDEAQPMFLCVDGGACLSIVYGGSGGAFWRIHVLDDGGMGIVKHEATDEDDDYTDKVTLTSDAPIKWVVLGKERAK